VRQDHLDLPIPEGHVLIYRPWITLKNGMRIYASQYGLRIPADRTR
jgi:hypothetical protein